MLFENNKGNLNQELVVDDDSDGSDEIRIRPLKSRAAVLKGGIDDGILNKPIKPQEAEKSTKACQQIDQQIVTHKQQEDNEPDGSESEESDLVLSELSYEQVLETVSDAEDVDEQIGMDPLESKQKNSKLSAKLFMEESSKFMAENNI